MLCLWIIIFVILVILRVKNFRYSKSVETLLVYLAVCNIERSRHCHSNSLGHCREAIPYLFMIYPISSRSYAKIKLRKLHTKV